MAGGSAGSIYVDLLLRDANFRQGLDRSRRNSKSATDSIKSNFSSLGKVIAGAVGGLSAGLIFNKFIQNTIEAQNAQAQLAAVLRSTGNAAGFTIGQLNSMANFLSNNSVFSTQEINNAQTRLLSYAGVLGENIPRAMQAVIDQSARLGISLEQSAETVGRALEQPSKAAAALSRQGFGSYFTKEVVEMLETLERQGKTAEAQVKILEVLEESYAGAANAARDTLGGALKDLNNTIDTILTSEGGLPELTKAINAASSALKDMASEGGIVEYVTNRLAISYLELNKAYNQLGASVVRGTNFFGLNDESLRDWENRVQNAIDAQNSLIDSIDNAANRRNVDFSSPSLPTSPTSPVVDIDEYRKKQNELNKIYSQYESIIRGVSRETISYERAQKDLQKLLESGKITQDEMSVALERYKNELEKTSDVFRFDFKEAGVQASRNIHQAFADFLFDPFEKGTKGMLEAFSTTLRRMAAEAASADILAGLFGSGGFGSGGGILSGIGSILSSTFAGGFATGGTIPAGQWGIVGERGPELAFGGNTGQTIIPNTGSAGGVLVNIINNSGANVSTRPGTNGASIDVMIDQAVAQNISTPGSRTNQALSNYNSRGLTRR